MRLSIPPILLSPICSSRPLLMLTLIYLCTFAAYVAVHLHPRPPVCLTTDLGAVSRSLTSGLPDIDDTFRTYAYRNHSECNISSLDLHQPFSPLCSDRASLLDAFTGGGRIGLNAPFQPRGCDMRWFASDEACAVLSRFERVIVVGDSMMRHLVGALNVLLRKDLGYGAVTNWNFNDQELFVFPLPLSPAFLLSNRPPVSNIGLATSHSCFCNAQLSVKSCSMQGIFSTASVLANDPSSLACPAHLPPIDITIEMMLKYPLNPDEVARYTGLLSLAKPRRPYAFILGHGLWNDLDVQATTNWIDAIATHTVARAPYLAAETGDPALWPRLLVTPNSAGVKKPDQFILTQGDKQIQLFEHSMRLEASRRGIDHLGTWNMSVQSDKYDGVHMDLKGNLIKAMAVLNWLAMLDVAAW
ncbi:hypothetical protein DV736_g722, partial [Chaetothyriales sp. CBS 134916]